jgi:hypothetical protein
MNNEYDFKNAERGKFFRKNDADGMSKSEFP